MPGNRDDNSSNNLLPPRSECECECHQPDSDITHETPCCQPDDTTDGKDGKDYF